MNQSSEAKFEYPASILSPDTVAEAAKKDDVATLHSLFKVPLSRTQYLTQPLSGGKYQGMTPLYLAAGNNGKTVLRRLFANEPWSTVKHFVLMPQAGIAAGWTALAVAAHWGHVEVLKSIFESSQEMVIAEMGKEIQSAMTLPLTAGPQKGWSALCLAAAEGRTAVFRYLFRPGINWLQPGSPYFQETIKALHEAIIHSHADVVDAIFARQHWPAIQSCLLTESHHYGISTSTGMTLMAEHGCVEIYRRLFKFRALSWEQIQACLTPTENAISAVYMAAYSGQTSFLQALFFRRKPEEVRPYILDNRDSPLTVTGHRHIDTFGYLLELTYPSKEDQLKWCKDTLAANPDPNNLTAARVVYAKLLKDAGNYNAALEQLDSVIVRLSSRSQDNFRYDQTPYRISYQGRELAVALALQAECCELAATEAASERDAKRAGKLNAKAKKALLHREVLRVKAKSEVPSLLDSLKLHVWDQAPQWVKEGTVRESIMAIEVRDPQGNLLQSETYGRRVKKLIEMKKAFSEQLGFDKVSEFAKQECTDEATHIDSIFMQLKDIDGELVVQCAELLAKKEKQIEELLAHLKALHYEPGDQKKSKPPSGVANDSSLSRSSFFRAPLPSAAGFGLEPPSSLTLESSPTTVPETKKRKAEQSLESSSPSPGSTSVKKSKN